MSIQQIKKAENTVISLQAPPEDDELKSILQRAQGIFVESCAISNKKSKLSSFINSRS